MDDKRSPLFFFSSLTKQNLATLSVLLLYLFVCVSALECLICHNRIVLFSFFLIAKLRKDIFLIFFCKSWMNRFRSVHTQTREWLWICKFCTKIFYYWCLFMCSARWSDLEKLLSHWTHLKGFRPVCLRWCRVNSSDLANLHSHPSQEHRYGFSPAIEYIEI